MRHLARSFNDMRRYLSISGNAATHLCPVRSRSSKHFRCAVRPYTRRTPYRKASSHEEVSAVWKGNVMSMLSDTHPKLWNLCGHCRAKHWWSHRVDTLGDSPNRQLKPTFGNAAQ